MLVWWSYVLERWKLFASSLLPQALLTLAIWRIWKRRNDAMFNRKQIFLYSLCELTVADAHMFLKAYEKLDESAQLDIGGRAKELYLENVALEGDSQQVEKLVLKQTSGIEAVEGVVNNIQCLQRQFESCDIHFVRRGANGVGHCLAQSVVGAFSL
ncbi:hypothetical protein LOK49_LG07G01019 [Camellia lanceoleosa]|uniref:Uncharacterized protein n=1 Tax=Camellia lanceoleosa TaxID=1840588 RepID=A0ACC0H060_9ERIC|nr:hypothetical protein LOK49_LG07G01019 [Camellia lanceoleosa]